MQLVIDSRAQSFALVKDWLFKQLNQMTNKVQASEQKLFEFGQKHDFYCLEDKDNVTIKKYIELGGLLPRRNPNGSSKRPSTAKLRKKVPMPPQIATNPLIMNLRQDMVSESSKVSGMNRTYLPGNPHMQVERAKCLRFRGGWEERCSAS